MSYCRVVAGFIGRWREKASGKVESQRGRFIVGGMYDTHTCAPVMFVRGVDDGGGGGSGGGGESGRISVSVYLAVSVKQGVGHRLVVPVLVVLLSCLSRAAIRLQGGVSTSMHNWLAAVRWASAHTSPPFNEIKTNSVSAVSAL